MERLFKIRRGLEVLGRAVFNGTLSVAPSTETLGGQTVRVYMRDVSGNAMHVTGTTVPADGQAGFAKGCFFVDTDVAAGTTGLYVNVGTTAACNFDAISDA